MKRRGFLTGLAGFVAVLLLVGAVGFYWIATQSPFALANAGFGGKSNGMPASAPRAALFVSRQTPAMASLLVNPDKLAQFRQLATAPGQRRQAHRELTQLKQGLLLNTGLDYEQDVKAWLGDEVTVAITTLDLDRDRSNGNQPGYLLALSTHDPTQSREFLQLFWQKRAIAGDDLTYDQYKGVQLISSSALASAVVGNQFVLFANSVGVLRDAITNAQAAELNLSQAPFYQQALGALQSSRIGLTFLNLPNLGTWLEPTAPAPKPAARATVGQPATSTSTELATVQPYQTLAVSFALSPGGLMADTALQAAHRNSPSPTPHPTAPTLSQPGAALQYLPATTPIAASGENLSSLWGDLVGRLATEDTVAKLLALPLQAPQSRWNIDLTAEGVQWITGDYALALLPDQAKGDNLPNAPSDDWILVAERAEPDSQAAIAHLDELAQAQGYSVGTLTIADQPVSAWTRLNPRKRLAKTLQADVAGVHSSVGNYEIFATSVAAMETALTAAPDSLLSRDRFQQAIAPFQRPNQPPTRGYFYIDWPQARPLLAKSFPALNVLELAGKPLLSHVQSLTLSSYGTQAGVQRGGVFFKLH
jgi:hypothetical protein